MSRPDTDWGDGTDSDSLAATNRDRPGMGRLPIKVIIGAGVAVVIVVVLLVTGLNQASQVSDQVPDDNDQTPILVNPEATVEPEPTEVPVTPTAPPVDELPEEEHVDHDALDGSYVVLEGPDLEIINEFALDFGTAYQRTDDDASKWLARIRPYLTDAQYTERAASDYSEHPEGRYLVGQIVGATTTSIRMVLEFSGYQITITMDRGADDSLRVAKITE